jgi:triphosphoribosyl-dephospho-CoA synthase
MKSNRLTIGTAATLACIWEATAPKPGNVHRGADFDDLTYEDFLQSAVVIGPILEMAATAGVGRTVLDAVRATQRAVGTNTNLGTLLLLAPLAAVAQDVPCHHGISDVLRRLGHDETRLVYEAIRISSAGGLGRVDEADVFDDVPAGLALIDAMRLAAAHDLVARQYTNQFADVISGTARWIEEGIARGWPLKTSIVYAHVRQLAKERDSLIFRKCGAETADEAQRRASVVLAAGGPGDPAYERALAEYDSWLRSDGHRRNPGTAADLIAAGLFVLFREGRLESSSTARLQAANPLR